MMRKNNETTSNNAAIIKSVAGMAAVALILFVSAGTIRYWQGVLYLALTIIMTGILYISAAGNPELIRERFNPGPGIKPWDRIYWRLSLVLYFATMVVSALDAGRFQLSSALPVWLYIVTAGIYILGNLILIAARKANRFFSSVVRIQTDRNQTVCTDGPYRYVRHPGYFGGFLFTAVIPLLLGSLWGLIPTGITLVLMLVRTALEDKTLENELDGYKAYQAKVRYRLLPYIW